MGALLLALLCLLCAASCGRAPEPEAAPETTQATTAAAAITNVNIAAETAAQTTAAADTAVARLVASVTFAPTTRAPAPVQNTIPRAAARPGGTYAYDYPGIAPVAASVPSDPYLLCVNRDYHLPANYEPALKTCVEGYEQKMEATAAAQYKLMYDAALAGGARLTPYSGYRSDARQKANFERLVQTNVNRGYSYAQAVNIAAQSILPPGCSEHGAGLAMDIAGTSTGFDATAEFAWLTAHAHEYGFILRYPKDKTGITQITYEPWHWRYVGAGPATAMKASGQCLEEYLGLG
ncbi:MAG: M15 family metallopeptidase [Oscillospiraceae bacterium]|nr:M15 family metallopeptidase [Oscillospiraceae bacterium]